MIRRLIAFLCVSLVLTACSSGREARVDAARLAASGGLRRMDIATGSFDVVAYARFGAAPVLRVYIEGDGHAWATRQRPSTDPTPWNPVALALAVVDPAASVAYLGRPCQYVAVGADPHCQEYFWTDGRYSEAVIASMNIAIDRLLTASGARALELVGFSGGGAVAALVAARRHDVVNLRTVAANLDTTAWTVGQHLGPLIGSLNPADYTFWLQDLPQMHFAGAADSVVDITISRGFRARFARKDCVRIKIVPNVGHGDGWPAHWPRLLGLPITCAAE